MARLLLTVILALCLLFTAQTHAQQQTASQPKQVVIVFSGPINDTTVFRLIAVTTEKVKQGAEGITLLISSNGGGSDAALGAYGFLRGLPVPITTHNFGVVDSAAVILYCAGTKRLATPDSRFVLHGISLTFQSVPLDENQVGENLRLMHQQVNTMAGIFAKTTGQPVTTIQGLINAKTVLSATQAKDINLVTNVESTLYAQGADVTVVNVQ